MISRLLTVRVWGDEWWMDREHRKIRRLGGDTEYGPGNCLMFKTVGNC